MGEADAIRARMNAALDIALTEGAPPHTIRAHLEWEAREMVARISPDKMTAMELAALVAVLHTAHARILAAPGGGRPVLRVVSVDGQPAEVC